MNLSILITFLGLLTLQATNVGTVRGSVVVAGTETPLSGVRVLVPAENFSPGREVVATTDENGQFTLPGVRPGVYQASTSRAGYFSVVTATQIAEIAGTSPLRTHARYHVLPDQAA